MRDWGTADSEILDRFPRVRAAREKEQEDGNRKSLQGELGRDITQVPDAKH